MSHTERAVQVLLRVYAVVLFSAVVPALMPFAWMEEIHRGLGLGQLPAERIVHYLTRSQSALYAMQGAVFFCVSQDVRRFLPLVRCLAVLKILFGLAMLALDLAVGMPLFWTLGEGPLIMVLGTLLLWLAGRIPADDRA